MAAAPAGNVGSSGRSGAAPQRGSRQETPHHSGQAAANEQRSAGAQPLGRDKRWPAGFAAHNLRDLALAAGDLKVS